MRILITINKMLKRLMVIVAVLLINQAETWAQTLAVKSPDRKITTEFRIDQGKPFYRVLGHKSELIKWSALGLKLKSQPALEALEIASSTKRKHSSEWKPLWEKESLITDEYSELIVSLKAKGTAQVKLAVVFRVFDDGVAWHYQIPSVFGADSIIIEADLTAFNLTGTGNSWAFNGERKNFGPHGIGEMPEIIQTPFLYENPDKSFLAIAEAEIVELANFTLRKSAENTSSLSLHMEESIIGLPGRTSWRAVLIADSEKELIESNLIVNLNPVSKIENVSWIKPGKSTWNWRGWGYKTADGYEYKIDTESQKRFIDFAAQNNIQYHLIDANWYGPEFDDKSDPSVPNPDFDIPQILAYAKAKDIGIFLYLNDVGAKKFGLERVLKQFHDWGAVGIKYGFMKGVGQEKVLHTKKVIELCAKYKLMLFFHDNPIPPSGDHKTWPHVLAREYGHAQADGKYSVYPESSVNQPFINMLVGPLDMNFGWFDLNEASERTKVAEAVPGTVAGEMARVAAVFSGFVCLPDVPEEYLAKPEMFDFLRRLPASFDKYEVLHAKIDQYFSVARRTQNDWIVASLTNQDSRLMSIKLDFLKPGKEYIAYEYGDAENSHYLKNKEAFKTQHRTVKRGDVIEAQLAPGGGHSIYLEMIEP